MSALPKGWEITLLNQVVDKIVGGGTPSKSIPSYYEGSIPWMTVKDMNKSFLTDTIDHITQSAVDNSSTNIIPAGTPIIATRMSLGKIVRASFDSAINQDLKALFVNNEMNAHYFEYWYRSQGMNIESLGTGTTVKGVRLEVINGLQFPLAPLAEQQRIVAKLDEVLAQVDSIKARLDSIPAILKRFRQSVLASAVSGKLTEDWRKQNLTHSGASVIETDASRKEEMLTEFPELKNKKSTLQSDIEQGYLFDIPASWCFSSWGKISEWITYGFTRPMPKSESGIKLLTAKDVSYFCANTDLAGYTTIEAFESLSDKDRPKNGDLLITKDGTIGRAAIVRTTEKFCINQSVAVCWLRSTIMNRSYLEYVANSPYSQAFVKDKASGVAVQHLSIIDFAQCPVPVPPLEEQKEIVRLVDQYFAFADTIETQLDKARARVDNLTQSILAKAFRGELVPQDPNDEPADQLLERIKAAKAEADKLAKAAKKAEAAKKRAAKAK
ncbi:restriction endonuclease subunit S [Paraferrimonas sp. SM1919]|uniref:restriction endonuclease subunit S n=1 Tax=Paraferrimonas sp. SM1919 TaxID=2662263 RepID=UPI001969C1DB|nr:restriction endonuclease subunit S [Paraferrimonas sp. SM1919]